MLKFPTIITRSKPTGIVTFADGTISQLKYMLALHDAGQIDINDYWSIGDKRVFHHSAMAATGVGETHAAQDRVWVIMDTGANSGYKFSDDTPVHFVVGTEDCFDEMGYMNSTITNSGSWNSSARRTWCNNVLPQSFDADARTLFKQFKTVTASEYNSDTLKTSIDYFALFAEKEIFGTNTYSRAAEANALTQIDYYKVTANRIKKVNGSNYFWCERSPYSSSALLFCIVNSNGDAGGGSAAGTNGVAPFGCI